MATQENNTTYLTEGTWSSSRSGEPIKPTLLAFHGSGSNATIHTVQLARLTRILKQHFEIVSMEAPFPSAAGPGILPFFEGCGPFKRWIPPHEKVTIDGMKNGEASDIMPPEVSSLIQATIREAGSLGSKVVGLIGFSQGTRVLSGLLKGAQIRATVLQAKESGVDVGAEVERKLKETAWLDFQFGVSVCGSYPPPLVPIEASELLEGLPVGQREEVKEAKIRTPTLHVLGKQDEWEWAGKLLIDGFFEAGGKSTTVWFEMGHHYPVAPEDSEKMRDWVVEVWREGGTKSL